jgi:hypothetical protein
MEAQNQDRAVGSVRTWEVVVGALFLAFGALVVWDSQRLGAKWGSDGPEAGYFPFYIGCFIIIASAANLIQVFLSGAEARKPFVEWGQLKMILVVMIPSAIYVALIANPWLPLGIYVASAIFIAFFMRHLAKYSWPKILAVSLGTNLAFFLMFEIWFKVPLPKGPLETALGFN